MNLRMRSRASSRDIFTSLALSSTSCIAWPTPPTGSASLTTKIGLHWPFSVWK